MKPCSVEHVLQKAQAPYICGYCKQLVNSNTADRKLNINEVANLMRPVVDRITKTSPLLLRKNYIIV